MFKNKIIILIILFLLLIPAASFARQYSYTGKSYTSQNKSFSDEGNDDPSPPFELKFGKWYTEGNASWQKSFANQAGSTTSSELRYEDIDSEITFIEAKLKLFDPVSLGLDTGFGTINNATNTDTDRASDFGTFSLSSSDVNGEVNYWGANVYVRLLPLDPKLSLYSVEKSPDDLWLDFFTGYRHYEDKLIMRNGYQIEPATGRFDRGLDSTYDFEWNYWQFGLQSGYYIIEPANTGGHGLELSGSFAWIPIVKYKGEGVWNLRDDLAKNPSFSHKSSHGRGLDATLALSYIYKNLKISAGYRYFELKAVGGTDTMYYSDGTNAVLDFDFAQVKRDGPFVSMALGF